MDTDKTLRGWTRIAPICANPRGVS